jgi:vitamin B12 transporter
MRKFLFSSAFISSSVAWIPTASAAEVQVETSPLEHLVVTATRATQGVSTTVLGSSVTVLEPDDIEGRQTRVVSDVLRDVPGVAISRLGAVGGLTQVRVRGTEGNHVLVLIDGMEVSDPFVGEFDFATLIADQVARIEVLRGQQSALYGSDAIGGVIHYMTADGTESPGFRARLEGGSFGSWDGSARFAGASETFDYAINAGYQTTDGVATSRFGTREVGAENSALSARFGFAPTPDLRFKAIARYAYTDAETNSQDFSGTFGVPPFGFVVDTEDHYRNKALNGLIRGELESFDDHWVNAIAVQGVDATRDSYAGSDRDGGNEGSRFKASYESTLAFGEAVAQSLTLAFDFEREQRQNTGPFLNPAQELEREIDNTGIVAQYDVTIGEHIGLGAALRHDDNDRFDDADTYRVQASYLFDSGTRLHAAAGSGIKNPGTFELFGFDPNSFIGNPDLKPERSEGWEVGVEQSLADRSVLLGATYFDNTLRDEIFTIFRFPSFTSSPANRTTQSTQNGYELYASARLGSAWSIDAAYTQLNARENGVEEVRRPPHSGSLNVGWQPIDRLGLNLTVRYNGEMQDSNFTGIGGPRVTLSEFTLVNLGADYRVSDKAQIYARVENLLDEDYEEVYTYKTAGPAGYLGVRLSF